MATGSMEGRAASGGLLPLASGTIVAICDCRLEGTLVVAGVYCGAGRRGVGAAACGTGEEARVAGVGVETSAWPCVSGTVVGETEGAGVPTGWAVSGVLWAGWLVGAGGALAGLPSGAADGAVSGVAAGCSVPAASAGGFLAVGSITGSTLICDGSVVASGMFSATGSLYSSPARPKSSWDVGVGATAVTGCGFSQPWRARWPRPAIVRNFACQGACGAAAIAHAAKSSAAMIAPFPILKPDGERSAGSASSPLM